MKKNNLLIIFLLPIFFVGCKSLVLKNNEEDFIRKAVSSDVFNDNFDLCSTKDRTSANTDSITIFNGTKVEQSLLFSTINKCEKKINFSNVNVEYDPNSIKKNKEEGILMHSFVRSNDAIKISFVDIQTNLFLNLYFNKDLDLDLEKTETGNF